MYVCMYIQRREDREYFESDLFLLGLWTRVDESFHWILEYFQQVQLYVLSVVSSLSVVLKRSSKVIL